MDQYPILQRDYGRCQRIHHRAILQSLLPDPKDASDMSGYRCHAGYLRGLEHSKRVFQLYSLLKSLGYQRYRPLSGIQCTVVLKYGVEYHDRRGDCGDTHFRTSCIEYHQERENQPGLSLCFGGVVSLPKISQFSIFLLFLVSSSSLENLQQKLRLIWNSLL